MNPAVTPAGPLPRSLLSTLSPGDVPPPDGLLVDPLGWSTFASAETDALLVGGIFRLQASGYRLQS